MAGPRIFFLANVAAANHGVPQRFMPYVWPRPLTWTVVVAFLLGAPIAQADEFCMGLRHVIADAPHDFRGPLSICGRPPADKALVIYR
jgi:hypothetical protein